jgi:hypothetical protein
MNAILDFSKGLALIIFAIFSPLFVSLPMQVKPEGDAKLLFVGDIFLDRYIRQVAERKGGDYLFECVDELFQSADAVVGNLEGPITEFPSRSVGSVVGSPGNFVFTFPTTSASLLARHNVKIVSLGNNHIGNFGDEGIEQTKKYLTEAGVNYFGGLSGGEPVHRTKIDNREISFIAYNQFGGDVVEKVAGRIQEEKIAKPKSTIIIFAHWGEEYSEPTWHMRDSAKRFAEAGASVVIGSHPHVVLGSENIGSTTVYYSLGNFIFDQYFEESVRNGLALEMNISKSGLTFIEHPVSMDRTGQTCLK